MLSLQRISVCKYILLHTAVFIDDWRLNGGVVLRLLKLWLSAKPLYLPHSATDRPAASKNLDRYILLQFRSAETK